VKEIEKKKKKKLKEHERGQEKRTDTEREIVTDRVNDIGRCRKSERSRQGEKTVEMRGRKNLKFWVKEH